MTKRIALALGACLFLAALPLSAEKVDQLRPTGYVNDFAGVLSATARGQLTALCQEVDQKAHAQIAVVIVRTLEGVPIEEFSIDLATRWGIGPKKGDRGVLILLATRDHKYRIEVGYGLEGILPDGRVGGFGREAVPLLRSGNYDGALLLITRRIADVIAQDRGVVLQSAPALPTSRERPPAFLNPLSAFLGILLRLFFPLIVLLLFYGLIHRRAVHGGQRYLRGPWWLGGLGGPIGGGGLGSGGFGGGGFGGFGGGGFGGGGASGGW